MLERNVRSPRAPRLAARALCVVASPDLGLRDWASLAAGPAGLIAETVLRNHVADFLRFRAVCMGWRGSTAHLHARGALDRRFHPRRWGWIMLPNAFNAVFRRRFLSVRTGERVLLEIPGIHRCYVLGTTAEGLVLVCRTDTYAVQLLNPLTGQIANLPHAATLLGINSGSVDSEVRDLNLRGAGLDDDDSTVVLHFEDFVLAVAKPGADSWTRLRFQDKIISALPFAGRIHCATAKSVSVVATMAEQRPQLAVVADHGLDTNARRKSVLYLVDVDGELVLSYYSPYNAEGVIPFHYDPDDVDEKLRPGLFMASRVELDTGEMVPLAGLDGQALFVGRSCSLLVPAGVSPSIKADTVYFCGLSPEKFALDLLGGSVERFCFNKTDAAYCISCYACRP
ncbi:unnamed protein product [Urochloa decumbens]|uniref:KIB1-4 beta-propeller domain-containing protein n=1 Tax=Urochloa decumbens TaxID=240449 RepID=A0ABC9FXW7_9POAL